MIATRESGVRLFLRHVIALRVAVLPLFIVGMMLGLPSTLLPALQSSTFGVHNFLYAGLFGACKGIFSLVVAPLLGVVSDRHGRKRTFFGTCCALAVPPFIMGFSGSFWAYSILDVMFGVYSGALSVLLATIADVIPGPTRESGGGGGSAAADRGNGFHAYGFSIGMAGFGLGFGVGSGIGVAVGVETAFRLASLLGFGTALYTVLVFPEIFLPNAQLSAPAAASPPESPRYHAQQDAAVAFSPNSSSPPPRVAGDVHDHHHSRGGGHDTSLHGQGGAGCNASVNSTDFGSDDSRDALVASTVPATPVLQGPPSDGAVTTSAAGGPPPPPSAAALRAERANMGTFERIVTELSEDAKKIISATSANRNLRMCFVVVLLDSMAEQMMVNLALLYLQEQLGFTDSDQLKLIVVLGVSGVVCLLLVVPFLTKMVGTITTLQAALVANAVSIGLYAFVTQKWEAIVLPLLCVLGAGVFPCTSAIAAATVSSREEGLAQGVTSGARMLAEGASPAILGVLFFAFKHTALPGAPFLVAAAFVLAGLVLSRNLRVRPDGSIITAADYDFDHEE